MAKYKQTSSKNKAIRSKMGLINFRGELKQKKDKESYPNQGNDFKVVPYPKETFLKVYDPLESL